MPTLISGPCTSCETLSFILELYIRRFFRGSLAKALGEKCFLLKARWPNLRTCFQVARWWKWSKPGAKSEREAAKGLSDSDRIYCKNFCEDGRSRSEFRSTLIMHPIQYSSVIPCNYYDQTGLDVDSYDVMHTYIWSLLPYIILLHWFYVFCSRYPRNIPWQPVFVWQDIWFLVS